MTQCIRIGFGKIARIHEEQLNKHGVRTIGVVELKPDLITEIEHSGLMAFRSIHETLNYKPDFYDICTPVHARTDVLKTICALNPEANILIEKPICSHNDIQTIRDILKHHRGNVVVNENYASSNVTTAVRNALSSRGIRPTRLIVESTKNRGADYLSGRYIDHHIGALGYEGSHLLAIVGGFGEGYEIEELIESDIDSIHFSADETGDGLFEMRDRFAPRAENSLSNQGGAFMHYRARNGCLVDLYTSMSGLIGFPCPPIAYPGQIIPHTDAQTRYRLLRVDGVDDAGATYQIVGFFEPVLGLERSMAKLLIFKNYSLEHHSDDFEDNTMVQHLLRAIRHFKGLEANPYSVNQAMDDVTRLHEWSKTCWNNTDDSDDYLGSKALADARLEDARRFQMTEGLAVRQPEALTSADECLVL